MMKILDSWTQNKSTAIFCDVSDVKLIENATTITINQKSYKIIGHDILTSLSGVTNAMFLLDTNEKIIVPTNAIIS